MESKWFDHCELAVLATSDSRGTADCSLRAGLPGFVRSLDDSTLALPDYRGNGVFASLGNMLGSPPVSVLSLDFPSGQVLAVHGRGEVLCNEAIASIAAGHAGIEADLRVTGGRRPERWLLLRAASMASPTLGALPVAEKVDRTRRWGTDDDRAKRGDYFLAKRNPCGDAHSIRTPPPAAPGEIELQRRFDTIRRPRRFREKQVLDRLNPRMIEFLAKQDYCFATLATKRYPTAQVLRGGSGLVTVDGPRRVRLRFDEPLASRANALPAETLGVALLFVDFFEDLIGLHVNGRARAAAGVLEVEIEEAYMHCAKHIPRYRRY